MIKPSRVVLALLACGAGWAHAAGPEEAAEGARGVLRQYCQKCHVGPTEQVKGGIQVFDRSLLVRRKVVRPGDAGHSELFVLADCGSMPPGDLPKPGPADVQALRDWIAGGAPDFPAEHGEAYVLKKIQKDLESLNPKDMPYQRYVSFNHLLAAEPVEPADPALWRDALLKALNHLSLVPQPVPVTPVDPAGTIFRVDERRLGWDVQPFETPNPNGGAAGASRVDLFDLILLEYPYATLPSRFGGDQKALADFMRKANPVRPILYVRGDWLVSRATEPPLYEDLLHLPRTLGGLETKFAAAGAAARGAFADGRMTKGPQLVERRDASAGAYWRTLDPGGAKDVKGLLREAASDPARGGLMLFSLPNGLNGYYIAENVPDEKDKQPIRLVRLAPAAPKEWVVDPDAADGIAHNGLSCMRCHAAGVEPFHDAARPALDELPPADKARLLPLFPGAEALDKFLAGDANRFQAAVRAIHGGPLDREPLGPVTRRFLHGAGAEPPARVQSVGLPVSIFGEQEAADPARFAADLDAPPLPPLDGLTLPDYQPPIPPVNVTIRSFDFKAKKMTTSFLPGDQLAIEVTNQGDNDAFIELIGLSMDGHMIVHQPPTKLAVRSTYRYPHDRPKNPKDFIEMALPPGVDRYILFASDETFPEGVRLRSAKEKDIADRVVHPFWAISNDGTQAVAAFDPSHLVKKTLAVETRAP